MKPPIMATIRRRIRQALRGMPWRFCEYDSDAGRLRYASIAWQPRNMWVGYCWEWAGYARFDERVKCIYLCPVPTLVIRMDIGFGKVHS